MFTIKRIDSEKEIDTVSPLFLRHLLWNTKSIPLTCAYVAHIPEQGLCIKMVCKESNPVRVYKNHGDPVYLDSAMEAFLMLPSYNKRYVNIEVNANGAVLAQYGVNRRERTMFRREEIEMLHCVSFIKENEWGFCLTIPNLLFHKIFESNTLERKSFVRANFYKVNEGAKPAEFASYACIDTKEPDFHRPEFFDTGFLE